MTITYEIDDNLYVNVTNKCPNACEFCVRNVKGAFKDDLWLEKEPDSSEIIKDILSRDLNKYKQLVFCGFGEPLERIDEVLAASKAVKEKSNINIRINTNGLANKIYNTDITPKLQSLIDSISISLNAKNAKEYDDVCHSKYGLDAFPAILDFAVKSKAYVKDVQFSVVDCLPAEDIAACQKISDELGIRLKIRKEIK
ncbi:MAG: TatD family nuclease-associated radical SAM protein [Bacillota bacterium]|nr:TatD family nuclease-associated radical SAM protein [Bacillota bacterium]